ncbi:MAG: PDZ domain-containing protein [Planctomycetota bacterium]
MTRLACLKASAAAATIAAAGLAAPAAAQNMTTSTTTSTTIVGSDEDFKGTTTRIIDGTEYSIEFGAEGVHTARIDGDETDFEVNGDVVLISTDEGVVRVDVPPLTPGGTRGFNLPMREVERLGFIEGAVEGRDFTWGAMPQPPTMVGLTQSSLDDQLRAHLDIEDGVGTIILSVVDGLPAAQAGIRKGDVLISVEGRDVTGSGVLTDALAELEAGDEVDVIVLRKGLPETMTITVAAFDPAKLYGDRLTGIGVQRQRAPEGAPRAPMPPGKPGQLRTFRWQLGDGDLKIDFDQLEEDIFEELNDIRGLDGEQKQQLETALDLARDQIRQALEAAENAKGELEWNADLLIRPDAERPIIIERERGLRAGRAEADRNREIDERLDALESKLDQLIEALADRNASE